MTILLNGFIHSVMYTYYFVSMHTSNIWSVSLSVSGAVYTVVCVYCVSYVFALNLKQT